MEDTNTNTNTATQQQQQAPIVVNINAKKHMPDLIFVLKAHDLKADTRQVLRYMLVDNDCFLCTDGRRLHMCTTKDSLPAAMVPGLYDVQVSKESVVFIPVPDLQFPDYKAVMPKYSDKPCITVNLENSKKDPYSMHRLSVALVNICLKCQAGKSAINIELLKDLVGYSWTVRGSAAKPKSGALHFIAGACQALIMPIKL